jgi:hypothetical protein
MDDPPERRDFDRFSIDFEIEVVSKDREGVWYMEKTTLEDISGEGARFLTRHAHSYYLGQSLEVMIYLPETDEVRAWMKGSATVVRMEPCSDPVAKEKKQPMCIAVKLDAPLHFERDDQGLSRFSYENLEEL